MKLGMSMFAGQVLWQGAVRARQAEPLRAGLPPDVALPLLAVVAQRAAERPGGRQPLRGELHRHRVERVEVRGLAAAER